MVKPGPIKDAVSMAHGTAYSEVHTSAAIRAPCHEYRNSMGFAVLTTYFEWKGSRYPSEGKACQSCHMYRTAGDVVDPLVMQTSTPINLHQMPGSHSLEQLGAATVLGDTRTESQKLVIFSSMSRLVQ